MFGRRQHSTSVTEVPSVIASFEAYLAGDNDEAMIRMMYPQDQWTARRRLLALKREDEIIETQLAALRRRAETMDKVERGLRDLLRTHPDYVPVLRRVLADLRGD